MDPNEFPKMLYKQSPAGRHQLQLRLDRVHETANFEVEVADSPSQEADLAANGFFRTVGEASQKYNAALGGDRKQEPAVEPVKPVGSETKQGQDANAKASDKDKSALDKPEKSALEKDKSDKDKSDKDNPHGWKK